LPANGRNLHRKVFGMSRPKVIQLVGTLRRHGVSSRACTRHHDPGGRLEFPVFAVLAGSSANSPVTGLASYGARRAHLGVLPLGEPPRGRPPQRLSCPALSHSVPASLTCGAVLAFV
jgi:hypothetical protein